MYRVIFDEEREIEIADGFVNLIESDCLVVVTFLGQESIIEITAKGNNRDLSNRVELDGRYCWWRVCSLRSRAWGESSGCFMFCVGDEYRVVEFTGERNCVYYGMLVLEFVMCVTKELLHQQWGIDTAHLFTLHAGE